ncbi:MULTISPECIES: phage tailspike protein [unclassified Tatumella]|uniref:phage tailspike protein n=1 Tax=unclassified Tatumella TaxID=2649542 RepID=UPI001BB0A6A5|nr:MULTISPECIES: phage tailspike protein [unclassified Tatumella]MBS0878386.1 hypothetical protein [Tatumella sp. JGM82]MBS0891182.1 hypothetical protein [Tatumella sp. JGM94]MBS0902739.1 hypothetical protein [Tatumella sp. JGM100]
MPETSASIMVSNPVTPFTMSRSFKACSNGKIFIGLPDTDPTFPQNQIPVYVENECGNTVQVPQPIVINSAGYPVYHGQVAKFVTTQNHSMAVYDSYMVQQFYWPDLASINPEVLRQEISSTLKRNEFSVFDYAPLNTDEGADWGPYFREAISAAASAGGGVVNFSGNLHITSYDSVGWVAPFDDGTIDPRRTADSTLLAENQTLFNVHLNLPSGVSLKAREPGNDSLNFAWDGTTIDSNQAIGICRRVNDWDGSYIATATARNRMTKVITNANLGGFSVNNCFMGVISDGIDVYPDWGDLTFNNCALPIATLGYEAGTIGTLSFFNCLTGLVGGGWWLQRNDVTYQGGLYIPPYTASTDIYSLGWIDSLKVGEIISTFGLLSNSGTIDKYLSLDKFYDKYFWKTANSTLPGKVTPTGDAGLGRLSIYGANLTSGVSSLQTSNPFRGIGGRAMVLASRYNRGNSNNELITLKSVNTPRGPIWLNPAGGPNGLHTISHNAYVENSGVLSKSGSRVAGSSNDWFSSGKDIWNADITKMQHYVGQGVLTTVFASPTNSIVCPASNSNQGGSSCRVNTMTGVLTAGTQVELTTMYNPSTGEWRRISTRYTDHDFVRGLSFSEDANYTNYFVAAEKNLDVSTLRIFNGDNSDNFTDAGATISRAVMRRVGNEVKVYLTFSLPAAAVSMNGKMVIGIPRYSIFDTSLSEGLGKYPKIKIAKGSFASPSVIPLSALHRGYFLADGTAVNGYHIIQIYSDYGQETPFMLAGASAGRTFVLEVEYESYNTIDSISLV